LAGEGEGTVTFRLLIAPALLALASMLPNASAATPNAPPHVAVGPFAVERDSAGVLRAVADSCLEHLVRALTAKGIAVDRQKQLSEKNLRSARPAVLAVVGRVTREKEVFKAELQLFDVESGEELRTYFNSDKNPDGIAKLGDAAAGRIATVLQERKAAKPDE
jgi:hypothetical protein